MRSLAAFLLVVCTLCGCVTAEVAGLKEDDSRLDGPDGNAFFQEHMDALIPVGTDYAKAREILEDEGFREEYSKDGITYFRRTTTLSFGVNRQWDVAVQAEGDRVQWMRASTGFVAL